MNTQFGGLSIRSISVVLPEGRFTSEHQTAADLGFDAAERIFENLNFDRLNLGGLVYVGASPDYRSPSTACVLHGRLGLAQDCLAFDLNQSGAGFGMALNIVAPLALGMSKKSFLIVLGDTPSKWADTDTIQEYRLNDAGTALLIERTETSISYEVKVSTWSALQEAYTIKEGGFRVTPQTGDNLDFLRYSASNYGSLKINDALTLSKDYSASKAIVEDLKGKVRSIGSGNIRLAGFYPESIQKAMCEAGIEFVAHPENLLGSTIPFEIVRSAADQTLESEVITALEFGEGLVSVFTRVKVEIEGILPLERSATVFENWDVDHNM